MATTKSATSGTLASAQPGFDAGRPDAVGLWLLICAAMILVMAVVGAITRLTESGLSIMEWAPLSGTLPPLSEAEWQRLFALYRETGEYQGVNAGMNLAEFKAIFWWEYLHRLWGRLIGLWFGGGFLWFLIRGRLERRLVGPLALLFFLGALQGLVGWYMVASGFSERTDVSQYRLVIHLSLAVALFLAVLWTALRLLDPPRTEVRADAGWLRPALLGFLALGMVTLVSGGFVAGLDAGFIYNHFPLMGGSLVPADYAGDAGWLVNAAENPAAAQLHHRALALLSLLAALGLWLAGRRADLPSALTTPLNAIALIALLQVALGIATLLLVVPVWLGATHQAGALILLGVGLWALHRATPLP